MHFQGPFQNESLTFQHPYSRTQLTLYVHLYCFLIQLQKCQMCRRDLRNFETSFVVFGSICFSYATFLVVALLLSTLQLHYIGWQLISLLHHYLYKLMQILLSLMLLFEVKTPIIYAKGLHHTPAFLGF